jgi:hypothetical protein
MVCIEHLLTSAGSEGRAVLHPESVAALIREYFPCARKERSSGRVLLPPIKTNPGSKARAKGLVEFWQVMCSLLLRKKTSDLHGVEDGYYTDPGSQFIFRLLS